MFKAPLTLVYILLHTIHLIFVLSHIQIGQAFQPLDIAYLLEATSSPSVQRNNIPYMNQALKQNIVMVNTVAELTWLTFFLKDLHIPLSTPPIIYYDNRSAMYIMFNPVFHTRNKYIEFELSFYA
jgi:hypothetical protein